MDPIVTCALQLMRWALAMLDKGGPTIAACRLQHAIDAVEAGE